MRLYGIKSAKTMPDLPEKEITGLKIASFVLQ